MSIRLISGPPTNTVTAKVAEEQLRAQGKLAPEVEVQLLPVQGQWVAAWHEAEFPPAKDEGPEEEEAGPPKDDGGEAPDGPPSDDGPSDDGGEGPPKPDGPPKEKGEKGGEAGELKQLLHMVTLLTQALGIEPGGPGPMDSPVPGPEGPPPPGPPGGGPPGPHGQHGGPAGPDQIVQHQRATKPGEAPPGVTPIGTPAFASVPADHPWINHIGKVASFTCASAIPEDALLSDVDMELQQLGYTARCKELPAGFKVKQVTEGRDENGRRIAKALISAY